MEVVRIRGGARNSQLAEAAEDTVSADCDAILFPAHPDGIRFLEDHTAWQSVRLSDHSRGLLENGTISEFAFCETAPGP